MFTKIHVEAVFRSTIHNRQNRKQSKCPLKGKWIGKLQCNSGSGENVFSAWGK